MKFSNELETTLHRALESASSRHHEYATIEHLLFSLIDDEHASRVMDACGVDRDELRTIVAHYLDVELENLKTDKPTDPSPTSGFQRIVQRSILHVQSSGREQVTGANVLVAMFSERESYAVYFLQQQDMSRLDAVSYISNAFPVPSPPPPPEPEVEPEVPKKKAARPKGATAKKSSTTSKRNNARANAPAGDKADDFQVVSSPIGALRILRHDLIPFSDAISAAPALATPKIAEKVVEFLSELLISEANQVKKLGSSGSTLAIGIYGRWGSGKSTLLAAISKLLRKDGVVVVPVNTWKWDGSKDIYAFMNEQLLSGLSEDKSLKSSVILIKILLWARRNFRKLVVTAIIAAAILFALYGIDWTALKKNPQLEGAKSLWAAAGAALLAALAKPMGLLLEKFILRNQVAAEPGEVLSKSYRYLMLAKAIGRKGRKPIYFMFDDLDRCDPGRVVEFMRSIHRLTASGSVSIVGCDDRVVAASIYSEFRNVADISGEKLQFGEQFLEKIVQVHFRMPDVREADLGALGLRPALAKTGQDAPTTDGDRETAGRDQQESNRLVKDLGQDQSGVDMASLQIICAEVLGAVIELYRLPIRRIKFLSNILKLYTMIFPPADERSAYQLATFLCVTHVDPQWIVDNYFKSVDRPVPEQRKKFYDRISEYLGSDREEILALYSLCGFDHSPCLSAFDVQPVGAATSPGETEATPGP